MTKEEAIKKIKKVIEESTIFQDELEAFDMAIEILENQESEKERIIKELEERITPTISSETYSSNEAFRAAIEIVRGSRK